jgi:predicted RNase H-like nuclease (RuvC/YqgF family)
MKLPWQSKSELRDRVKELEQELDKLRDEKQSLEERFESEQERRKKLSRQKQEAEEELNRLKDRLESADSSEDTDEEEEDSEFEEISFREFRESLEKLDTMRSEARELVTVYSQGELADHQDVSGVKNSLPGSKFEKLSSKSGLVVFSDSQLGEFCFRARPFFQDRLEVDTGFHTGELLEFFETEKHWALVSRGNTRIYRESGGDFEEVEHVKDRVNRQHGKGGFSQSRFERKRDEQVEQHLEKVEEELEGLENLYLLGEEGLCNDLPGERLGGFDPNSSPPEVFYQPRKLKN